MSIVVLYHSDVLSLASNSKVVAAEEVGSLQSMLEQSRTLTDRLATEESRLNEVESRAYEQGHESGFRAGKQEGLDAAAQELAREKSELAMAQSQVQQQATSMAIDIVRKLADTLDPVELLSALAITAARSCPPDELLVLRVHEKFSQPVSEKIGALEPTLSQRFQHIIGDATVALSACIIESQTARILADLETQTQLLESQLVNG